MSKNQKTEWNLSLLYKSDKDPQIEKDLLVIEKAYENFERKYRKADFVSSPEKLAKALRDYDFLMEVKNGVKPWWYFALKTSLDSGDSKSEARATKYDQRVTISRNKTLFFMLQVSKLSKPQQKKFLSSPKLAHWKYALERVFKGGEYRLTEQEEQLSGLLSQTSYDMWCDGQKKLLNDQHVLHKGKKIPIAEASVIMSDLPKKERDLLQLQLNSVFKRISYFAEAELNAIYNFKKVMDERRGFKKSYSSTIFSYENDEKSIELFCDLITKNFTLSHRFYRLHARLLKEKKLKISDRGVKIGKIGKTFDFETAVSINRSAFAKVDPKYASILDDYLQNGQIDVYPKKGKTSGAFCWGVGQLPTFVLLNYANNLDAVSTLGHEMGHAIHTEFSKKQPVQYQHYSTSTAEVASTFFEQVVSYEIEKTLTAKEKLVFMHNKLLDDMTTIFRQMACYNFQVEFCEKIKKEGQVSKESMAQLMSKHLRAYLGDAFDVSEDDGYFFVNWAHLRWFFYVYSYAYGQLVSKALFEKWKEDPSYAKKIEQFLSAGRSMSPESIFKSIGINVSDPKFFKLGLKSIENDIIQLEKLSKKFTI